MRGKERKKEIRGKERKRERKKGKLYRCLQTTQSQSCPERIKKINNGSFLSMSTAIPEFTGTLHSLRVKSTLRE